MTRADEYSQCGIECPQPIQKAFKIALDPTPRQVRLLLSNCGGARVAYNTMLAVVKANLEQRAAEKSYGIDDGELTQSISWSAYSLRMAWNRIKADVAPWWADNSKESYEYGCFALAKALANFAASKVGARAGELIGFPRFKSRARSRLSVTFAGASVALPVDRHSVRLPRIGRVHTHESTAWASRRVDATLPKVNSVTVSYQRGRWFASFQVETAHAFRSPPRRTAAVVGIDLGVKDLLVVATPDGIELERIRAPKCLAAATGTLRALQRKAARQVGPYNAVTGKQQAPSASWTRTQSRVAALYARVANLRDNHLHQVTTRLARTYTVIGVEDLNVKGMLRKAKPRPDPSRPGAYLRNNRASKRGLSRSIADASLGTALKMLGYKTSWYGADLYRVDRYYPSSKTCSGCGAVKTKLLLSERKYHCTTCGLVIDRDLNAAVNIAREAQAHARTRQPITDGGSPFASGGGTGKTHLASAGMGTSLRNRNPMRTKGTPSPQGDGGSHHGRPEVARLEN